MGINNDCSVIRDGRVPLSPRPNIVLLLVSQGFKTIWTATPNGHFCYCHTLSLAFEHVQMWDRKHLDLEKVLVVCVCVCVWEFVASQIFFNTLATKPAGKPWLNMHQNLSYPWSPDMGFLSHTSILSMTSLACPMFLNDFVLLNLLYL